MIERLLIANRGEIAVRVARGARELGIVPLGIYSQADAHAYHLTAMDDARCVGPAPATASYLNIGAILDAAREMRADAVHPGYGFLSENAAFARAVVDAGMIFVGPPPEAIARSGSKIEAKRRAHDANVPTIPGYDGEDQSPERLCAEAERIGFPVLVKASAGGGGRGMRVVTKAKEFDEALAAARREALGAFGDDTVLLERYLQRPRHIEFQILADAHGTTLHIGERECSIQRRHQKVVEEAPSVALTPELRAEMGAAAVRVAQSVGYVNAGTAEFMLDHSGYYFLEMNARLQVEHPVTETVYGVDLVHWQLRIASGERLTLRQDELVPRGWAIETRVTAEDPSRGMLPSAGTIERWEPPDGPGIRVDAGVMQGSTVGLDYDSLLAKLIVYASDRPAATARLVRALDAFAIEGISTNLPLLRWIAGDDAFRSGDLSTSFLSERLDESRFASSPPPREAIVLAVAARLLAGRLPWRIAGTGIPIVFDAGGEHFVTWASATASEQRWLVHGALEGMLEARRHGERIDASVGTLHASGEVSADASGMRIVTNGRTHALAFGRPPIGSEHASGANDAVGRVTAPMPGRVLRIAVSTGEKVAPQQLLVVLEAMKMEHRIEAPSEARIGSVLVREGEIVAADAPLVELE